MHGFHADPYQPYHVVLSAFSGFSLVVGSSETIWHPTQIQIAILTFLASASSTQCHVLIFEERFCHRLRKSPSCQSSVHFP